MKKISYVSAANDPSSSQEKLQEFQPSASGSSSEARPSEVRAAEQAMDVTALMEMLDKNRGQQRPARLTPFDLGDGMLPEASLGGSTLGKTTNGNGAYAAHIEGVDGNNSGASPSSVKKSAGRKAKAPKSDDTKAESTEAVPTDNPPKKKVVARGAGSSSKKKAQAAKSAAASVKTTLPEDAESPAPRTTKRSKPTACESEETAAFVPEEKADAPVTSGALGDLFAELPAASAEKSGEDSFPGERLEFLRFRSKASRRQKMTANLGMKSSDSVLDQGALSAEYVTLGATIVVAVLAVITLLYFVMDSRRETATPPLASVNQVVVMDGQNTPPEQDKASGVPNADNADVTTSKVTLPGTAKGHERSATLHIVKPRDKKVHVPAKKPAKASSRAASAKSAPPTEQVKPASAAQTPPSKEAMEKDLLNIISR